MNSTSTYALPPAAAMFLIDAGIAVDRVLRRAGLPVDFLSRGTVRLPAAQYHALWSAMEQEAGMDLALLMGRSLRVENFDSLLFAILCCPDLASAIERAAEFKPLVAPLRIEIERPAGELTITINWPPEDPPPTSLGFAETMFWVSLARLATRASVVPTRVLAPTEPPDALAYREYFGIAVEIGKHWSLTFSDLDASRPFLTADAGMWQFFEPELRRRLAELGTGASITERVTAALLEALPAGDISIHSIARKLALSARSLQRHLNEEGVAFQALISRLRMALSLHYLRKSQLPTAEISFLLGYQDESSFYRAFKAWTGYTPEAARAGEVPDLRIPIQSGHRFRFHAGHRSEMKPVT